MEAISEFAERAGVLSAAPKMIDLGDSQLAYWKVGRGEPLLLVHGYPVSGRTWRGVVERLASDFTCYVVDLPGAGETHWTERTDFNFAGQARTLKAFVDRLELGSYLLMAHDTGATIARRLATLDTANVRRFILIGTEIPGHRPPWIELFQKTSNPKRSRVTRTLLDARCFRQSGAGLGGCFADKSLIEGDFKALFIDPVVASSYRAEGLIRYLQGIDWSIVDGMATEHARITMPTLMIWGADDPVFPVVDAVVIERQLPDCRGFFKVPGAKLFVHEEKPDEVARLAREFCSRPMKLASRSACHEPRARVLGLGGNAFAGPRSLDGRRPFRRFGGKTIRGNRDGYPALPGLTARVLRAHVSLNEALLPFAIVTVAAMLLHVSSG